MSSISAIDPGSYGKAAQRPYGIALGVIMSLILHALLIYGFHFTTPSFKPEQGRHVASIAVWIRPLLLKPKPPEVKPPPKTVTPPQKTPAKIKAAAPAPASPTTTIAPAAPAADAPSQPPAPPDPFAEPAPKFDIEAARRTARQVASERDPAKVGTAVGQIPDQPLATETKLARDMARAARSDCREALASSGLLAPLLMLMDKKDSGCKW